MVVMEGERQGQGGGWYEGGAGQGPGTASPLPPQHHQVTFQTSGQAILVSDLPTLTLGLRLIFSIGAVVLSVAHPTGRNATRRAT